MNVLFLHPSHHHHHSTIFCVIIKHPPPLLWFMGRSRREWWWDDMKRIVVSREYEKVFNFHSSPFPSVLLLNRLLDDTCELMRGAKTYEFSSSTHAERERDKRQLELKTKLLRAFHVGNLHFHSNQERNVEKKVKSETARKGIDTELENFQLFITAPRCWLV